MIRFKYSFHSLLRSLPRYFFNNSEIRAVVGRGGGATAVGVGSGRHFCREGKSKKCYAHMDMVDNVTVTLPLLNKLLFPVTTTIR